MFPSHASSGARASLYVKKYDDDTPVFVANNDNTGCDITSNAAFLKAAYLTYTQSEHVCSVIKSVEQNSSIDAESLLSSFMLIDRMLSLPEDEYANFYETNMAWIEEGLPNVNSDKSFWNNLIITI